MKDKITIGYILVTVVLFGFILVYFANIDFKENNSRIEDKSVAIFKKGKHYSEKLYDMVAHNTNFGEEESIIASTSNDTNISVDKKKIIFSSKSKSKSKLKGVSTEPLVIKKKDKITPLTKTTMVIEVNDINKSIQIKDVK